MLLARQLNQEGISHQKCRVKRVYKKCAPLKLCNPQSEFDMIENCKDCKKQM